MKSKKYTIIIAITLLFISQMVFAAADEDTELQQLQIQEKMAQMLNQSDEGLEVKVLEDGTEYVDLKGRFQMFSKVKIVDGKQVFVCNGNPEIDHKEHQHISKIKKPSLKQQIITRSAK